MLKCMICGYEDEKSILSHVRNDHGLSADGYKAKFPGHPLRAAWVNSSKENMEKFKEMARANSERMIGNSNRQSLPNWAWSQEQECCIKCGTVSSPHASNGLCHNCWTSKQHAAERAAANAERVKNGKDGVDYVICMICGAPFESLTTAGHLSAHKMTVPEYKAKFPLAKTICEVASKRRAAAVSAGRRKSKASGLEEGQSIGFGDEA